MLGNHRKCVYKPRYFFEAMNAAAVIQIPLIMSVWDDGYGISVDNKIQTVKSSISEALMGFQVKIKINLLKFLELMDGIILK